MKMGAFSDRIGRRCQRAAASAFARRPFLMKNPGPLISFTFDDFPRSSLSCGGTILEEYGARGTYYVSLGLAGQLAPTGDMFTREDLSETLERGHELGCHTFHHCDASITPARVFEESILENRRALRDLDPTAHFKSFSYPIGVPWPSTKKRCAQHFLGCRAGGQTFNAGTVDLNYLQAYFLEQSRDQPEAIVAMIEANCRSRGWLIFATHDVCENPTRYGCRPDFFSTIVERSVRSGAQVVSVSAGLAAIGAWPGRSS